jgi:hypothetical protein
VDSLSSSEQYGHYERMGEAYFDAVDETAPGAFENGKIIMEGWVVDEFVDEMGGGHVRKGIERCGRRQSHASLIVLDTMTNATLLQCSIVGIQ